MNKLQQLEQTAKELQEQIQELKNESRKFKVGDTIKHVQISTHFIIVGMHDTGYIHKEGILDTPFKDEQEYKLVPEKATWWEPKSGSNCIALYADGVILDSSIDVKNRNLMGNAFKTREEAEKERDLRQATYRLKKAIFELNGGFVEWNWCDFSTKYYVCLTSNRLEATFFVSCKTFPSWYYLKNASDRYKLMLSNKEDLLIFLNQ